MISNGSHMTAEDSRQYLQMLQDIINRMATNSSNCKAWMITIYTAMMALIVSSDSLRQYVFILLVPIIVFYFLDAFYLGLETDFRKLEEQYVEKLKSEEDCSNLIYNFNYTSIPQYRKGKNLKKGLMSKATWPVYLSLFICTAIMIGVIWFVPVKEQNNQDIDLPLKNIASKQDSIACSLQKQEELHNYIEVQEVFDASVDSDSNIQQHSIP